MAPGFDALLDAHTNGGVAGLLAACADAGASDPGAARGWRPVADAVRLGVHALTGHPERLAGQLAGRLAEVGGPVAATLVDQATAWRGAPWGTPWGDSLGYSLAVPGRGGSHRARRHPACHVRGQ